MGTSVSKSTPLIALWSQIIICKSLNVFLCVKYISKFLLMGQVKKVHTDEFKILQSICMDQHYKQLRCLWSQFVLHKSMCSYFQVLGTIYYTEVLYLFKCQQQVSAVSHILVTVVYITYIWSYHACCTVLNHTTTLLYTVLVQFQNDRVIRLWDPYHWSLHRQMTGSAFIVTVPVGCELGSMHFISV